VLNRRAVVRFGGICGLLYVVLAIPSFVVGHPALIDNEANTQEVVDYFNAGQDGFLIWNGLLFTFAAFFFLWFLGILHNMLRRAEGAEETGLPSVALAGGLTLIALKLVGVSAEIHYPSTLDRFENFLEDAQLAFLSLELSGWLYHYAYNVGAAVLIAATSVVALNTGLLPRWLVWAGLVVALIMLLNFIIPLGSVLALLWVVMVSVLMLAGSASRPRPATG
jgi:hypothetical protein